MKDGVIDSLDLWLALSDTRDLISSLSKRESASLAWSQFVLDLLGSSCLVSLASSPLPRAKISLGCTRLACGSWTATGIGRSMAS